MNEFNESRLNEITGLKKHIINYSKTRDVYAEYRKSSYSKLPFCNDTDVLYTYS